MPPYKEKISVIIPVYNEEKTITGNITKIREHLNFVGDNREFEIIVVDDGSTDNTWNEISITQKGTRVIHLSKNEGKGAAFMAGLIYTTTSTIMSDYIVFMDSDLQIDVHDLESFFRIMLIYNAQVVVGNKRHQYSYTHYPLKRRIISEIYNFMCRLLFGISLRDTQCGMKLFKRAALEKVIGKLEVKRFAFDLELIVALRDNDIRIVDAPVRVLPPAGPGSVNVGNIWHTFKDTLAVWWRWVRGWYKVGNK